MARKPKATTTEAIKRPGRPALPDELKRTSRISVRTYPDIADKVTRNGTEWLEAIVRKAKEATQA